MEINKHHREQFVAEAGRLGFDDPFLESQYDMMATEWMESYQMDQTIDFGDDRMLFRLDLKLDESGLPYLHGYEAMLLKTHPILHHGMFNGIDTTELENRLKQGDWNSDMEELSKLFEQLTKLTTSGNATARDIAERLEARYWVATPVDNHINVDRWKERFGRAHYFRLDGGFGDITVRQAYNLLSGRQMVRFEQARPDRYTGYWFGLKRLANPSVVNKERRCFEEVRYNGFDIAGGLRELCIKEMGSKRTGIMLIRSLTEGDLAPATMETNGLEIPVYLSANPQEKSINIYDKDLKELDIGESVSLKNDTGEGKTESKPANSVKINRRNRL